MYNKLYKYYHLKKNNITILNRMSFKDKPLKKIVADKRVTIDAIHQEISSEFVEKKKQYHENIKKKEELEKRIKEGEDESIRKEIDQVSDEINSYNQKKEVDYYLDTGVFLNEYYSKKQESQINTEITVVDFMKKNKTKKEDTLINSYMRIVDDTVIKDNFTYDLESCPLCLGKLVL